MRPFSYLFIIFGVLWCLLGGYYLWQSNASNRLQFNSVEQRQTVGERVDHNQHSSQPTHIIIKELGIHLMLIPASIKNDVWETTYDGASYLVSSPLPGAIGNSIIYAHNWESLFGKLLHAKPGQVIEIVYADGSKKKFIVRTTATVAPTQSDVLDQSKDKKITLYTCTGFFDSKRFVVVAMLDETPSFASVSRH